MLMEKDPYIEEVKRELERISNDPKRREEYEAREDALRDYVTQKKSFLREGTAIGEIKIQIEITCSQLEKGKTVETIADILNKDIEHVREIMDMKEKYPEYSALELAGELLKESI